LTGQVYWIRQNFLVGQKILLFCFNKKFLTLKRERKRKRVLIARLEISRRALSKVKMMHNEGVVAFVVGVVFKLTLL
jgi:hypothetical protein